MAACAPGAGSQVPRLTIHAAKVHAPIAAFLAATCRSGGVGVARVRARRNPFQDCAIAVRDMSVPPQGLMAILGLLHPLDPIRVSDGRLRADQVHLWIAGPEDVFDREVLLRCADRATGERIASQMSAVGFQKTKVVVKSGLASDTLMHSGAPVLARDVAALVLHAAGAAPLEIDTDDGRAAPEIGTGLVMDVFAPALSALKHAPVVETDDPDSLGEILSAFRRVGFAGVEGRVLGKGAITEATLDPGSLEAAGEEGTLARLLTTAEGILGPKVIADFPVRRLAATAARPVLRLPVRGVRTGSLRPYAGQSLRRWPVRIFCDDYDLGLALAKRLKTCGFSAVERRRINDRVDGGFAIHAGRSVRSQVEPIETITDAMRGLMLGDPHTSRMRIMHEPGDDEWIEIFAPFRAASQGLIEDELDNPARFEVILRAAEPEAAVARLALRSLGYRRIKLEPRAPEEAEDTDVDLVEYGAASNEMIARLRHQLAERLGPPIPLPARRWRIGDARLRITLTSRTGLSSESKDSHAERNARTDPARLKGESVMTADGYLATEQCSQARPFIQTSVDRLRVGRAEITRAAGERTAAPAGFTVDPKSAEILEHLAFARALGEPVLIEGDTGTSKSAAVQYLAHLAGGPFVRLNLGTQTDMQDLAGRYEPGPQGWVWQDGPLTRMLRLGGILLLDEISRRWPRSEAPLRVKEPACRG